MKKFFSFLKNDYLKYLTKLLTFFIITYLFLIFSLNYLELFLINLDINTLLVNHKEEILRFLSSEDLKELIKNTLRN
jgi:hypothetical protein